MKKISAAYYYLMNKTIIVGAVALVVGVGVGYFASTTFAQTATNPTPSAGSFGDMRSGMGGVGGLVAGTVASKDAGSITVSTKDGSSHVVLLTPATTFMKSVPGTVADVAVGSTLVVSGAMNADGSVSATSIQLRPAGTGGAPTGPGN